MRIVIAPNAFKNSLTASEAATAIEKGLQQSKLDCETICFPVGDGGDGTAALLINHLNGERITVMVHDPLGRMIESSFGLADNGKTAIIEMADASGLRLLKPEEYDPLHVTTFGTGELIKAALDKAVKKIIICIGGSATVDAGTGILKALGAKFFDIHEQELEHLPGSMKDLFAVNLLGMDKRLFYTELFVLCDVENTLLGEHGAAKIFGPQKGATKENVQQLEEGFKRLCNIVYDESGKDMSLIKHGGAAGGVSAGLHTFLHAKLVNGIDHFLDATSFNEQLNNADLVITGEGSIDTQTLQGKGPFGVAQNAKKYNLPVIGIAGRIPMMPDEKLHAYFDILLPINNEAVELSTAMQYTYENLVRTARSLGDLLAINKAVR
ncbi:glycerate kinase [soil metagenome]